jgi:hypothetical protein
MKAKNSKTLATRWGTDQQLSLSLLSKDKNPNTYQIIPCAVRDKLLD